MDRTSVDKSVATGIDLCSRAKRKTGASSVESELLELGMAVGCV